VFKPTPAKLLLLIYMVSEGGLMHIHMRCGYKVLGIILLQAYLYTYCLLRGVTLEVLPLSS